MKAPREYKRWMDRMRRKHGKPNGVVYCALLDNPWMECKLINSKARYRRSAQREAD